MPALKDIGRITELLGVSPLSTSPLWTRAVDKINTHAMYAFVARMSGEGKRDQAETAISIAIAEVKAAVGRGEFSEPEMVDYRKPERVYLTAGELRNGLRYAQQPKAAAILFALETHMTPAEVEGLTWTQASRMKKLQQLSTLAEKCLLACPQQIRFKYAFWQQDDIGGLAPVRGIDHAVFDAFGMVWAELENGYANLIRVDGEADRKSIETFINN